MVIGLWHAQLGAKALFIVRNDEPYSSWIAVLCGPLSTLPAVALGILTRRWGAAWLVAGALVSLGASAMGAAGSGHGPGVVAEHVLAFLLMVSGPMIALGSGLIWLQRRYKGQEMLSTFGGRSHFIALATFGCYLLLSLGALFVADLSLFKAIIEPQWGFGALTLLLGPLMMLATWRLIGVPTYLAETVVVLGLLWLAITQEKRRRAALLGALVAWIVSGLFFLAIVFAYD